MSKLSLIGRSLPDRILSGKLSRSHKFTSIRGITGFKISMMFIISILMLSTLSSSVLAAETKTVDGWIRIDPDTDEMTVNMTWNMSDPSNSYLFNWNQTVDPFEQDNNLTGSFTGTFLPPIEFQVTEYVDNLTLLGLVKFKSTWIMSGSTESWWRIPCQGPGWGDSANLTIWHIDSPATLEVTDSAMPNNISHPVKVFDQDFDMDVDSLNKSVMYWNGTAWNRSFNSTWVRVGAQIHTDEFYLVRWVIYNNGDLYQIRFSSTDQCEDRTFRTWVIQHDGTKEIYGADLDYSVLHILGMGYAVWGNEIVTGIGDYIPIGKDDISESLTPSGPFSGDWLGIWSPTLVLDTDIKKMGIASIKSTDPSPSLNHGKIYLFDSEQDISSMTYLRLWWMIDDMTNVDRVEIQLVNADNEYYFYRNIDSWHLTIPSGEWYFIDLEISAFTGEVGTFDNTRLKKIYFIIRTSINDQIQINEDMVYFADPTNETEPSISWNIELDEPITEWDYLTVMIPFLDVVDNSTNVRIGFGTQNDSWSTFWWVAENGPTDFGIKSVQWDVAWPATDMKITMTIYNRSRSLWIMDHNPDFNPDVPWSENRYTVDPHEWAPDDYYFGGIPYYSMQVTNGSWENTFVSGTYYLEGREVDPDQLFKKRQDSDNWLIEIFYTGYRGIARCTAAFSFGMTGHMDRVWDILDPDTPFPLDAPWYLGKYYFSALVWLSEFASGLGDKIWSGLCWLYEAGAWIVNAAGWVFAGVATLIVLMIIPPVWSRFFKAIWGLIKFGWILAQDGVLAASEFADTFWKDFMTTSYVTRIAKRIPIKRRG